MADFVWLALPLAFAVIFGVLEFYAIRNPKRLSTLSLIIKRLGEAWPMTLVIFGFLFGALAGHFFWPLCP